MSGQSKTPINLTYPVLWFPAIRIKIYKYYFIVNSYFLIFNNKHEAR